ncbi:hypothetical protein EVB95_274 [Rhizobium phage RHph_TM2_3B]|nr:hypothetical protein EVB95_274 [Rhizobium phage RHph_TM2_3B]
MTETISLNEVDHWVETNLEVESIVDALGLRYKEPVEKDYGYSSKVEFTVNISLNSEGQDLMIIDGGYSYNKLKIHDLPDNAPVQLQGATGAVSTDTDFRLKTQIPIQNYIEGILDKLPNLIITKEDIIFSSIYVSNVTGFKTFANDMNRFETIEIDSNPQVTLYVTKDPLDRYVLRYNPTFILKTIIHDWIFKATGFKLMAKYGGAMSTFAYMLGHEILHYRFDHFNPVVSAAIDSKCVDVIALKKAVNPKMAKSIVRSMRTVAEEIMVNSLMSQLMDMPAVDSGLTTGSNGSEDFSYKNKYYLVIEGRKMYSQDRKGRTTSHLQPLDINSEKFSRRIAYSLSLTKYQDDEQYPYGKVILKPGHTHVAIPVAGNYVTYPDIVYLMNLYASLTTDDYFGKKYKPKPPKIEYKIGDIVSTFNHEICIVCNIVKAKGDEPDNLTLSRLSEQQLDDLRNRRVTIEQLVEIGKKDG